MDGTGRSDVLGTPLNRERPRPSRSAAPRGRSRFNDSSGLAVVLVVAVAGAQRGSVSREAPAGVSVGAR